MKKFLFFFSAAVLLVSASVSQAAVSKELTYSEEIVWRCAVRFLRVDSGYTIIEKDKETGYLLFEFSENGATYNGSLEVLKRVVDHREYVRVQVNLNGQPKYVESLLFKKLERKLKSEYGMAPAAKVIEPPEGETTKSAESKQEDGEVVDEDAEEEDLRITEDDLNEDQNRELRRR